MSTGSVVGQTRCDVGKVDYLPSTQGGQSIPYVMSYLFGMTPINATVQPTAKIGIGW